MNGLLKPSNRIAENRKEKLGLETLKKKIIGVNAKTGFRGTMLDNRGDAGGRGYL